MGRTHQTINKIKYKSILPIFLKIKDIKNKLNQSFPNKNNKEQGS